MTSMTATDLTSEAFSPYGEVFAPGAVTGRLDHVATLENRRAAAKPNLFLAASSVIALPHDVARLESHPWSSQSFAVFAARPLVIGVAVPGADGQPDMRTFRAFLARSQGFSYRAGIWHLPVASLGAPVTVLGFMYEDGTAQDCVWAEVEPVTITG